ncbi:MAG: phosphoribosylformylglycinamidine synthase subunit PurL [candidate division WOR-3 bacterium]|nr:phosphoribosylformylglycinamidine synthase subunit PurL [candidate division WOR-3 bacterium]
MNERIFRILLIKKIPNPEERALLESIKDLGLKELPKVKIYNVYYLSGPISKATATKIAKKYFCDPVVETFEVTELSGQKNLLGPKSIEIIYKPGVMDPEAEHIAKALDEWGYPGLLVKTAKVYQFISNISNEKIYYIARNLLYNPLIQEIANQHSRSYFVRFSPKPEKSFKVNYIEILDKSLNELVELSRKHLWALNRDELKTIQEYYRKLKRNPTDIEIETFAQTWSEHCKHKTFQAKIIYKNGSKVEIIDSLFKSYIKKVTYELNKPWCLSVFEDNSGVIEFNKDYGISFKVETHNHPSALEPYGGASTGIGGVIRDCLGTGLGSKPIANTDVFCFAPPDLPAKEIPPDVLHPRRIIKGVVYGVRDYGNRMGIPTVCGAVAFDKRYLGNPLVYCGTIGLIPKSKLKKKIIPGDLIVLIGGRTGRDGIHGVTFASLELESSRFEVLSQAVQIGNPIEEKKITDLMLEARDQNLFNATTDCGGGGLSSAIGELARCGAVVELDKVPLKYHGLSYTEIWISESQERMILFVPPKKLAAFLKLAQLHNVEATVIGKLTDNKKLVLKYYGKIVGELDLEFLHHGLPQKTLIALSPKNKFKAKKQKRSKTLNYNQEILFRLADYNIASKEWIVRQYDFEVQGRTVIKPFVGKDNDGPSDAVVLKPLPNEDKGLAISCGLAFEHGEEDCYWMAASAIDEALRNIVAVGADPNRVALLDNFSWGSPERPKTLGKLVNASRACYEIAKIYGTPFISGKDSLYNEYKTTQGKILQIPATLLISAIGVVPDIKKVTTLDFKAPNEAIYLIGEIKTSTQNNIREFNPYLSKKIFHALHNAITEGLITACHDVSEGGLAVALAEMCFSGAVGCEIYLERLIDQKFRERLIDSDLEFNLLFLEYSTRFIVSVPPNKQTAFERKFRGVHWALIGNTTTSSTLKIYGLYKNLIVNLNIDELKRVWATALTNALH